MESTWRTKTMLLLTNCTSSNTEQRDVATCFPMELKTLSSIARASVCLVSQMLTETLKP